MKCGHLLYVQRKIQRLQKGKQGFKMKYMCSILSTIHASTATSTTKMRGALSNYSLSSSYIQTISTSERNMKIFMR